MVTEERYETVCYVDYLLTQSMSCEPTSFLCSSNTLFSEVAPCLGTFGSI